MTDPRPLCMVVRPSLRSSQAGGDEVVYRRTIEYLSRGFRVVTLELGETSRIGKYLGIVRGNPPEATRYLNPENARRLSQAIARERPDVVCFFNEVSFPFSQVARDQGLLCVLLAHNVHSLVAASDPGWFSRLLRPLAVAFERRWYADPSAILVCLSQADVEGLHAAGIGRAAVLAPPGAPPSVVLDADAKVVEELVLLGSYAWWRKRRDLRAFVRDTAFEVPVWASDPIALGELGMRGRAIACDAPRWSGAMRFGLVTDRFRGGFKLKSTEYVAMNCIVLSYSDISREFEGLPHADRFIRTVRSASDIREAMADIASGETDETRARFLEFKAACLQRYDWQTCLKPLGEAIGARLAQRGASARAP